MKRVIILVLVFLPLTVYGQVYKCQVDGKTIYQGEPCLQGEVDFQESNITSYKPRYSTSVPSSPEPPLPMSRPVPERNDSYRSNVERRNAEARAHARGYLVPGMSENQAITILGTPDNYRSNRLSNKPCKYYYWDNPSFSPGYHRAKVCGSKVMSYYGPNLADK